jgi:hypothetical protein
MPPMKFRPLPYLLSCLLLGCVIPACSEAPDPDLAMGRSNAAPQTDPAQVTTPIIEMAVPEGWQVKAPTQSFYLNMWDLPGGGVASISWFGASTQMIQANLNRWIGQMAVDEGTSLEKAEILELSGSATPTTAVFLPGTLTSTAQVGGGDPRTDWILMGAILKTEAGPLYVKALGPEKMLGTQRDAFLQAIQGLKIQ